MWLAVLLAIPAVAVVALVLWSTSDLYSQHVPDAAKFFFYVLLTVVPPVAWAIAEL